MGPRNEMAALRKELKLLAYLPPDAEAPVAAGTPQAAADEDSDGSGEGASEGEAKEGSSDSNSSTDSDSDDHAKVLAEAHADAAAALAATAADDTDPDAESDGDAKLDETTREVLQDMASEAESEEGGQDGSEPKRRKQEAAAEPVPGPGEAGPAAEPKAAEQQPPRALTKQEAYNEKLQKLKLALRSRPRSTWMARQGRPTTRARASLARVLAAGLAPTLALGLGSQSSMLAEVCGNFGMAESTFLQSPDDLL